jgi:hypothetical protein
MIGIGIRIGVIKTSNPVLVVVATSATGVGETSFTANWNPYSGAQYYLLDVSTSSSFLTFVLQNQVVSTNSYIVTGLTASTTYYYRVRASTDPDPDAQAFFSRVTTAGGTLSTTEQNAVNQLVIDLKANSLWTPMKAIYPMVGASAAACAQNLRSSSFTGTFTATGWTFASTGVSGNGTSAFMDTAYIQNNDTSVSTDNFHQSFYINNGVLGDAIGGVYKPGEGESLILPSRYGTQLLMNSNNLSDIYITNTIKIGYFICSRYQVNTLDYYLNGINKLSTTNVPSTAKNTIPYYLGLLNSNGTPAFGNASRIALSTLGQGLTPTQASNFYTTVQKFNQSLNRQVGAQLVSDPDAQAYIDRVYNAGGSLTNTEANAVNQLVLDMKTAGIWDSMKAVYPMVGSSAAACAQNLKSSSFTGTFTSGWTFASTGATPNGSNAFFDTTLVPSTSLTLNSTHISMYSRTNSGSAMYDYNAGQNLEIVSKWTDDLFYYSVNAVEISAGVQSSSAGFFNVSRTASNSQKAYYNGAVKNTSANSSTALPIFSLIYGALNGVSKSGYSNRQTAFLSAGDGLTDVQATALYNSVQIMQNTLGRAV